MQTFVNQYKGHKSKIFSIKRVVFNKGTYFLKITDEYGQYKNFLLNESLFCSLVTFQFARMKSENVFL